MEDKNTNLNELADELQRMKLEDKANIPKTEESEDHFEFSEEFQKKLNLILTTDLVVEKKNFNNYVDDGDNVTINNTTFLHSSSYESESQIDNRSRDYSSSDSDSEDEYKFNYENNYEYESDSEGEGESQGIKKMIRLTNSQHSSGTKVRPGNRYEEALNQGHSSLTYNPPQPGPSHYYNHPPRSTHFHQHPTFHQNMDSVFINPYSFDSPYSLSELSRQMPTQSEEKLEELDLGYSEINPEAVNTFINGTKSIQPINQVNSTSSTNEESPVSFNNQTSSESISPFDVLPSTVPSNSNSNQSLELKTFRTSNNSMANANEKANQIEQTLLNLENKSLDVNSPDILHQMIDKVYKGNRGNVPKEQVRAILHNWQLKQYTSGVRYQDVLDANGCSVVIKFIDKHFLENLIMFLCVGPDLNIVSSLPWDLHGYRGNALHHAIRTGHKNIVKALVKHIRAPGRILYDVASARDPYNWPPMAMAVNMAHPTNIDSVTRIIRLLLEISSPFSRVVEQELDNANSTALDSFAIAAKSICASKILPILMDNLVDFTKFKVWTKINNSFENLVEDLMNRRYEVEKKPLVQLVHENKFIEEKEKIKLLDYIIEYYPKHIPHLFACIDNELLS